MKSLKNPFSKKHLKENCSMEVNFPKYTHKKHKGNVGEAAAQYFLSKFSLVHKIDGSNDLGNDFICELIKDTAPTNLLFYIQVKSWRSKPTVSKSTRKYWELSPIPVYIIWIKERAKPGQPDEPLPDDPEELFDRIYYKRMTPELHNPRSHRSEKFKKYNDVEFRRDLMVDYTRTQNVKGLTPIINARDYLTINEKNLMDIDQYVLYIKDVIPEYKNVILKQAWVQNFAVAELLYNEGGNENYKKALQSIDLAVSMISDTEREKFYLYYERMKSLRTDLHKIMNQLENKKGT